MPRVLPSTVTVKAAPSGVVPVCVGSSYSRTTWRGDPMYARTSCGPSVVLLVTALPVNAGTSGVACSASLSRFVPGV